MDDQTLKLSKSEIQSAFQDSHWPPCLTVEQAAALLQVPIGTIYDWHSRGRLKGCVRRVGKYLRFFRDRLINKVFNEGLNS